MLHNTDYKSSEVIFFVTLLHRSSKAQAQANGCVYSMSKQENLTWLSQTPVKVFASMTTSEYVKITKVNFISQP